MGYSLGDDKESFDVFERTTLILEKIGEELIKNNWIFSKEEASFSKDNRKITLELDQDHITSIYIFDDSINWEKFIKQNDEFEAIYGDNKIDCVEIYASDRTNIKKLVNKLEYAPLLEKDLDYTLLEY